MDTTIRYLTVLLGFVTPAIVTLWPTLTDVRAQDAPKLEGPQASPPDAPVDAPSGSEPETRPVDEAALVLGRILEKGLTSEGIEVGSIQWAHVAGRGLLVVLGVSILDFDTKEESAPSADDVAWDHTRKELRGERIESRVAARGGRTAVETVRKAVERFAGRVPVPAGEEVRVALYGQPGGCFSCHVDSPAFGSKADPFFQAVPRTNRGPSSLDDPGASGNQAADPHVEMKKPNYVVVGARGRLEPASAEKAEDVAVFARVADRRLKKEFPDEYWGIDRQRRPGALGLVAGDWGPVVVLNLTFNLERASSTEIAPGADEWNETARELRVEAAAGQGSVSPGSLHPPPAKQGTRSERFLSSVREIVAGFAYRVRGLEATEDFVVLVYASSAATRTTQALQYQQILRQQLLSRNRAKDFYDLTGKWWSADPDDVVASPHLHDRPARANYQVRVAAADLRAATEGRLDHKEISERIRIE